MPTANQEVLDRGVRHAIHLARLRTHEVNQIVGFLNDDVLPDARKKLTARLERISTRGLDRGPHTTKALREMIEATQDVVDRGLTTAGRRLGGDLNDIALTEAEWQQRALAGSLPGELAVDLGVNRPTVKQLNGILGSRPFEGDLFKNWWKKLRASAKADIGQQVQIGIASGETNQQIVRRLAGTKAGRYMDGAFGKLRRNVASTVQTATNHVSTQTREMTYKANEDIVKGVRIVATLDHRTTEICMSEDGKVYPVNEGPRPPFHWNCRTTTAPELRSLSELGLDPREFSADVRARMTGHAPRRETYGTWLRRQPAAVQNDALGPRKGRLFRKHRLSVNSFVDDKRRTLTLDELRVKEGLVPAPKVTRVVPETRPLATKKSMNKWLDGLSKEEREAVYDWTLPFYEDMRAIQAGTKTGTTVMRETNKAFLKAVNRAPRYVERLWRGLSDLSDEAYQKFQTAKTIQPRATASHAISRKGALSFAEGRRNNVIVKIAKQRHAVDLRAFNPVEEEIVVLKDVKFRVTNRRMVAFRSEEGLLYDALEVTLEER